MTSALTKLLLVQVAVPAVLAALGALLIVVAVLRRRSPTSDGGAAPLRVPTRTS